jgi:cytochrome c peroxidase
VDLQQKLQSERDAALRQVQSCEIQEPPIERPPLPDPALLWQMRAQAGQSEYQRRSLERARFDAIHQATVIAGEKDLLEREVRSRYTLHCCTNHLTETHFHTNSLLMQRLRECSSCFALAHGYQVTITVLITLLIGFTGRNA